jgi:NhaP-type Na+/H+ or K+/H+ antiporter
MLSGWDIALIGATLVGYALFSRRLAGTFVTAPMVFVVAGFVLGSEVLDLFDVSIGSSELRLLAEVTLALLLFSDASALDTRRLARESGMPLRLLGLALPLTIVLGSVIALLAFPDLLVFEAVALAVLLAPTDAALGQTVVSDTRLPSVVRQGLNAESGLNDGICVPLLVAAVTFAELEQAPSFDGEVLIDLVEELAIAISVGIAVAVVVAFVSKLSVRRGWMEENWGLIVPLAATAAAYAATVELGGSGFIAAFVAGLIYGRLLGATAHQSTELTENLGGALSAVTFLLFGALVIGRGIPNLDAATVIYAVLSLTIVRMAPVAISLLGSGARRETAAFAGWFGPRGLASIVFALTIVEESGLAGTARIVDVATITILMSVFAHGLTAPWLTDRYVRWVESNQSGLTFETRDVELAAHTREPRPSWLRSSRSG